MSRKAQATPLSLIPAYDLKEVKRLVREDHLDMRGESLRTARQDFDWGPEDVKRFLLGLRGLHFCKRAPAEHWDTDWLDVYRAEMFGHKVYTHFFVDDQGELVIVNSFKADTSGEPIP